MLPKELTEELKLLKRALREETFRIIIIEHQNYTLVAETQLYLQEAFPQRTIRRLQTKDIAYRQMMDEIYQQASGILLIADTEEMLANESLSTGFNQRRDKLATFPLAIILFVSVGKLPILAKRMPDIFSRISLTFNWEAFRTDAKNTSDFISQNIQYKSNVYSSIGKDIEEKRQIFTQLEAEIAATPPTNLDLLEVLYRRYIQLAEELAEYQVGLEAVKAWMALIEKQDDFPDKEQSLAYLHDKWGNFAKYLGDYQKAKQQIQEALEWAENAQNQIKISAYQNNLALVYRDLGEYEKAKHLLELALASAIQNFSTAHLEVAIRQNNLALVYQNLGQYDEARDLLEIALPLAIQNYGTRHIDVATIQFNLAVVYQNLEQYEKARDLLERVLASNIQNYGTTHPSVAISQIILAMVYQNLGQYEKARDLSELALASAIENFGDTHPNMPIIQSSLAILYMNLKDYTKAKSLFESAYQIWLKSLGENHPKTKEVKSLLEAVTALISNQEKEK